MPFLPAARLLTLILVATPDAALMAQQPSPVAAESDVKLGLRRDPALAAAIAETRHARETDSVLVSFGTRHTMTPENITCGIGAASIPSSQVRLAGMRRCPVSSTIRAMMEMRHPQRPMVTSSPSPLAPGTGHVEMLRWADIILHLRAPTLGPAAVRVDAVRPRR
jgi:hypothetical protein